MNKQYTNLTKRNISGSLTKNEENAEKSPKNGNRINLINNLDENNEIPTKMAIEEKSQNQTKENQIESIDSSENNQGINNITIKKSDKISTCEKCMETISKTLTKCYLCKKRICRACIVNSSNNIKKKEHSNYICPECIENESMKKRNKHQNLDFGVLLDYINFEDARVFNLGTKRRRNPKKSAKKTIEKEFIDMNAIHDCVTPPSEIELWNTIESKKKELLRNTKDNTQYTCHQCLRKDDKIDFMKCRKEKCDNFYCIKCIRLYKKEKFDSCFSCKKVCQCLLCLTNHMNEMKNSIELEGNKNLVRIENFLIVENGSEDDFSDIRSEKSEINSESMNLDNVIEKNKNECEINQREKSEVDKKDVVLNNNIVKINLQKLYQDNQESCSPDFDMNKVMSDDKNNIKSKETDNKVIEKSRIKFISKKFKSTSGDESKTSMPSCKIYSNGNYNLAQISNSSSNSNQVKGNCPNRIFQTKNMSNQSTENNHNMISFLNDNLHMNNRNNNPIINHHYNNQNRYQFTNLVNKNNSNPNIINFFQNQNFNFNMQRPNYDTNIYSKPVENESNKLLIDELRKSFFTAQYYSVIQKIYISYIMKNIELILSNFNKISNLEESVINNISNTIQDNISDSFNVNNFVENLNYQINLLKNINGTITQLSDTFNNNFGNMKNCGIKIFKAMHPAEDVSFERLIQGNIQTNQENHQEPINNTNRNEHNLNNKYPINQNNFHSKENMPNFVTNNQIECLLNKLLNNYQNDNNNISQINKSLLLNMAMSKLVKINQNQAMNVNVDNNLNKSFHLDSKNILEKTGQLLDINPRHILDEILAQQTNLLQVPTQQTNKSSETNEVIQPMTNKDDILVENITNVVNQPEIIPNEPHPNTVPDFSPKKDINPITNHFEN